MLDKLNAALAPLVAIAKAYHDNGLDDEARKYWGANGEHENTQDPQDIELYSGRGGARLLTLEDCLEAHYVQRQPDIGNKIHALRTLVAIADAYDANELDDEARKTWGRDGEHENTTAPADIELYCGRGGGRLLTLAHCLDARALYHQALLEVAA